MKPCGRIVESQLPGQWQFPGDPQSGISGSRPLAVSKAFNSPFHFNIGENENPAMDFDALDHNIL